MEPLFIGSHLAADFLNTAFEPNGEHVEIIGDGRALMVWLQSGWVLVLSGIRIARTLL